MPPGMDWIGDGDHDYGNGREYSWWTTQKAVTLFTLPEHFVPVYSYERSVALSRGPSQLHVRPSRRALAAAAAHLRSPDVIRPAPDTNLLYMYLHYFERRLRLAHVRHRHGHRLAQPRPGGRAVRRDLPGRPQQLRAARLRRARPSPRPSSSNPRPRRRASAAGSPRGS